MGVKETSNPNIIPQVINIGPVVVQSLRAVVGARDILPTLTQHLHQLSFPAYGSQPTLRLDVGVPHLNYKSWMDLTSREIERFLKDKDSL